MKPKTITCLGLLLLLCFFVACAKEDKSPPAAGGPGTGGSTDGATTPPANAGKPPAFSLAWSEYPSWSVFGVAHEKKLINGREGEQGPVEKEWNVDIVLKELEYETCITTYINNKVDAVCITNMDTLAPSKGRDSVAILPTSTSVGADACIAVDIESVDALQGKPTYGLEKSVSQYAFERSLELLGKDLKQYEFKNMDPAQAATAMQTVQPNIQSIMVWNPFVLDTLRKRDGAKVLFDSSSIPEEIIDMVVIGKDSLAKPGGKDFACAVIDVYYRMNELLEDPVDGDKTLVALGAKFSSLGLEDMKLVVQQTRFYKTPEAALGLFESEKFQNETMPRVVSFCALHGIVEQEPTVAFGRPDAQVNFDATFIKQVQQKRGP